MVVNGSCIFHNQFPRSVILSCCIHKKLHASSSLRKLMWKKEFDTSYVGFTKGGAQWLVDNTDIKLIGKQKV